MSFIAYLIVLIFAAGSALFGLDLLTAPLPQHAATHVATTSPAPAPDKLVRRMADEKAMQQEGKPGTLTPVYPSHPGITEARPVTPANPATRAETQNVAAAKPAETTGSAPRETTGVARGEDEVTNAPAVPKVTQPQGQPVAQPAAGHCDIAACAAAYHSFRASDCTYQPYEGARRACAAPPPAQRSAERAKETAPASTRVTQSPAPMDVRAVARQQLLPQQDDYDGDAAADDDVDAPDAPPASIVIIQHPRW